MKNKGKGSYEEEKRGKERKGERGGIGEGEEITREGKPGKKEVQGENGELWEQRMMDKGKREGTKTKQEGEGQKERRDGSGEGRRRGGGRKTRQRRGREEMKRMRR